MGPRGRDDRKNRAASRPFGPAPERSLAGTFIIMCALLAGLFVLYQSADRYLLQRAAALKAQSDTHELRATPAIRQDPAPSSAPAWPAAPEPQPMRQALAGSIQHNSTVTKCVVNGKTSYGDGACGHGAVATPVLTRSNQNLMAAVAVPVALHTDTTVYHDQGTVVAQSSPAGNAKKAECDALDARIKQLDAMARQPQSGQTQDWITAERKQARDRQYRLRC